VLILQHHSAVYEHMKYMVIIKAYKVRKKFFNKFPEISRKIKINFRKFSAVNFRTYNPSYSSDMAVDRLKISFMTTLSC